MNIGGFDVVKRNLTSGDGVVDTVIKVKTRDQSRYVEMGAKYLGMLTEKHEHTHLVAVKERLRLGDERVARKQLEPHQPVVINVKAS